MIALIQRVKSARVVIDNNLYNKINHGMLIFLGIKSDDNESHTQFLAKKICNLRIFNDNVNKMNLSVQDIKGSILVISQFTLYGQCNKGNRPSFVNAAPPEKAKPIYKEFIKLLKKENIKVKSGKFGSMMNIQLINDGPVTIILES